MRCPVCDNKLDKSVFNKTEVDVCPNCLGLWFEDDELRWAKDNADEGLTWLDVDLWEDETKFKISSEDKLCPSCRLPMYEVKYGDSDTRVDVCSVCKGVWLDRGEFKDIIDYLHEEADEEVLNDYLRNVIREGFEIFIGPEPVRDEIEDFVTIMKMLKYKIGARWPHISKVISDLPE
ncbi:MAG: zf-TFIIB domain-containing protein [Candidatus Paceibacterota bacterium]